MSLQSFLSHLLAITLLFQLANSKTPYTTFGDGCHAFEGTVKCRNRASILPTATVELWESDDLIDDHFGTGCYRADGEMKCPRKSESLKLIKNGKRATYSFESCDFDYDDIFYDYDFEMYFYFKDVCSNGDRYEIAPASDGKNHGKNTIILG